MPTILIRDGFEVLIYTGHEHRPPHVHVFKAGSHLRVALGEDDGYPYVFGKGNTLAGKDLIRAVRLVAEHRDLLLDKWRTIHG
jgi:hypothetical protein